MPKKAMQEAVLYSGIAYLHKNEKKLYKTF